MRGHRRDKGCLRDRRALLWTTEVSRLSFFLGLGGMRTSDSDDRMLPQTSSSQFPFNSVSALILAGPAPPTRVSKSIPPLDVSLSAEPFTAVAERSSMRCESRKNWSCSFSTRSPNFLMTAINRWNCSTFSTVQDTVRKRWTENES